MPSIPAGSSNPAPEGPPPGDAAAAEEAVSPAPEEAGVSATENQPAKAAPVPPAVARYDGRPWNRLLQKKVVRPVILAAIAVVSGLIAWWLYPSRPEVSAPGYTTLQLDSPFSIDAVNYAVYQRPSTAEIVISVLLSASTPPVGRQQAELLVFPPLGVAFGSCPPRLCTSLQGNSYAWDQPLTFRKAVGPSILPEVSAPGVYAFVDLYVNARVFGVTADGVNASAAIPKLIYNGPGTPNLLTRYNIQAASLYDWSTFPPASATNSHAEWLQQTGGNGVLPDVVAAGINHANQSRDNDLTFLAGALVGVAGGALRSAVQEALHARD